MPIDFPASMHRSIQAMLDARFRMVCSPSSSFSTSSGCLPWTIVQYVEVTTGIWEMVKNLLSSSKVDVAPERLALTMTAPTFMDLSIDQVL